MVVSAIYTNCIKGLHNRWAQDIKDAVDTTEQFRVMNSSERMDAQNMIVMCA